MCTILTVDKYFFQDNMGRVIDQISSDYMSNSDGFTLVCLDYDNGDHNIKLSGMSNIIVPTLIAWFESASNNSRMFLHQRFATTSNIGLAYNHGFEDSQGNIIMHNGILKTGNREMVDSFVLKYYDNYDANETLQELQYAGEQYGNIFVINELEYSVIRLVQGSLYTDDAGNYSTHPFSDIQFPVDHNSCSIFYTGNGMEYEPEDIGDYYNDIDLSNYDNDAVEYYESVLAKDYWNTEDIEQVELVEQVEQLEPFSSAIEKADSKMEQDIEEYYLEYLSRHRG